MMTKDKIPEDKSRLHPRNKNRERYNLSALVKTTPALKEFILPNKYGQESIDFSNPKAVKLLNQSLLQLYYGITYWDFPEQNLCPPIPGRADYLHYMADVLAENNFGKIPTGNQVTCLDIGVGASCIYPVIGVTEYGWNFIGSDIDKNSIETAQKIVEKNPSLKDKIQLSLQKNKKDHFYSIIDKEEKVDLTICNPPFHSSIEDAQKGTRRKVKNLSLW